MFDLHPSALILSISRGSVHFNRLICFFLEGVVDRKPLMMLLFLLTPAVGTQRKMLISGHVSPKTLYASPLKPKPEKGGPKGYPGRAPEE